MAPVKRKDVPIDAQSNSKKLKTAKREKKHHKHNDDDDASVIRNEKPSAKEHSFPRPTQIATIKDDEPSYPRGGASVLTPLERKEISVKAKRDVLFEEKGIKRPSNDFSDEDMSGIENGDSDENREEKVHQHKSKRSKKNPETLSDRKEGDVRIEALNYKRIVPGSIILGQVSNISDFDLTLSLPNNLVGFVPAANISEKLTQKIKKLAEVDTGMTVEEEEEKQEMSDDDAFSLKSLFTFGQYLRAYVISNGEEKKEKDKKHLELSLFPSQANYGLSISDIVPNSMIQASVLSIEEHGAIMDLGIKGAQLKGFMSSKEFGPAISYSSVKEGMVFLCLVTGISDSGIVKLCADPQKAGDIKKSRFLVDAPTIDAFLPGTAVQILLSTITSTGLAGKIMGLLDVTADLVHSGAATGKDLEKIYKIGDKAKARIIYTYPSASRRKVGVSFLDHVVGFLPLTISKEQNRHPLECLPLSTIINDAKIFKIETGKGLFMDVGVKNNFGFVHISRISDDRVDLVSGATDKYKIGTIHQARVTGYNPMDRLFLLSMQQSIIEQPFLRVEDVKVGEKVEGTVERLIENHSGNTEILVKLAEGIVGLVPNLHLADVHLEFPARKFKIGMPVKVRVLAVKQNRRILLTLKRTLVNSDAPVWASYGDISPGDRSPGTIFSIQKDGALIEFYGAVKARLPVREMSEAYIKDPRDHFRIGQVVDVHALSVNPDAGRMKVSCKDPSLFGEDQQKAFDALSPASVVNGTVTEITSDDIVLDLTDSSLKARLPLSHLTDGSDSKNSFAMKKLRVGQLLKDLVVVDKHESRKLITLSNKPSLVQAARNGTLPKSLEDVQEGMTVTGFVQNITEHGIFVRFASHLCALLPRSKLTDEVRQRVDFGMRQSQSVTARVCEVDYKQKRIYLSQQPETSKHEDLSVLEGAVPSSKSVSDFVFGKRVKVTVKSVKSTQLNVELGDGIQGRIDVSEVFDSWSDIKTPKQPLCHFSKGDVIDARVLGIHDSRNHRFLPISHRNVRQSVVELTAKPSDQMSDGLDVHALEKLEVSDSVIGFVNNIRDDCLWVNVTPNIRGRVRLIDISNDISTFENLSKNYPIGSALRLKVTAVVPKEGKLDLSAKDESPKITLETLSSGTVLPGRIIKVGDRHVIVQLSDKITGQVPMIEFDDDYDNAKPTNYTKNQIVRVCITSVDIPNKKISLSMRPSKALSSSLPVKDREITSIDQLKVNDVVRGFVKRVADNGLFITLGINNITGYVRISDISDLFIKDWKSGFQVDQLVKGKTISIDPLLNHIQLSLKASVLDKNYVPPITFSDMKPGQIITGKIRSVETFGVFIVVDNSSNVSGLCHKSEMADKVVEDVKAIYSQGDIVKAKVLAVNLEKRRINFGLKASYLISSNETSENGDHNVEADGDDDELASSGEGSIIQDGNDSDSSEEHDGHMDLDIREAKLVREESDAEVESVLDAQDRPQNPTGGFPARGFDWTGGLGDDDAGALSDAESIAASQKKKSRKSQSQRPITDIDRTGSLDSAPPSTIPDFERRLLGSPNSSELWLGYMALHLRLAEVDKARQVSERALQTINISETEEKFNVWIARLNLEVSYGDDSTVDDVLKQACEYCDEKEVKERLISTYITVYNSTGKTDKNIEQRLETLYTSLLKPPLSSSSRLWLNYATYLLCTLNSLEKFRALLPRALERLPKSEHIGFTVKIATLEFRHGDAEVGRTLLAGITETWKKRWDVWGVWLDLEIAHTFKTDEDDHNDKEDAEAKEQVRRLFKRITSLKLKVKKAKSFFDKWLRFEEKVGDHRAVEQVKVRAEEFVRKFKEEKEQEQEVGL